MPDQSDKKLILWVSLILDSKHDARDAAKLSAVWQYAKRAGVTTLLIKAASMHELPDALNHSTVKIFLYVARTLRMKVIWGRNVWVKKMGIAGDVPTMDNAAFYAAAISNVNAEARSIGAKSFLDGEPYSESTVAIDYKRRDLPLDELWRIKLAIRAATDVAGAVDYSYPADAGSPERYQWCMRYLGDRWLNAKTYLWRRASSVDLIVPGGFDPWRIDNWGSWVTHDQSKYPSMSIKPLTPEEAIAIKVPRQWLYIGGDIDEYGPTLKAFAEAREKE